MPLDLFRSGWHLVVIEGDLDYAADCQAPVVETVHCRQCEDLADWRHQVVAEVGIRRSPSMVTSMLTYLMPAWPEPPVVAGAEREALGTTSWASMAVVLVEGGAGVVDVHRRENAALEVKFS